MKSVSHCPLCGRENQCALALPPEERPSECWCVSRDFPPSLLERADPGSCICADCQKAEPTPSGGSQVAR